MQTTKNNKSQVEHPRRIHRLKNHPFVVPVVTFLILFIFTMAGFIFLGGKAVGPSDSHIVKLYVDGNKQVLPSRAMTVGELLEREHIELAEHDVVEPSKDAQITDDNFSVNVYRAHAVTIIDQDHSGKKTATTAFTAQQAPAAIAQQAGITVYPEDKVEVAASGDITQEGIIGQKLVINRALPIKLNLFGITTDIRTHAKTVEDVLKERAIKYDGDSVSPSLETAIKANDAIFVTQPGKKIATEEQAIPFGQSTINDPSLALGKTKVQSEGVMGKKVVVYEIAADGSRKSLQEVVVIEPVAKVTAKGTKIVSNRISGDKSAILSAAGVPISQQSAADFVISRESGWNLTAHNAGGCVGLGQACPGSKLVSACPDWESNAACQVRFFSGYANGRYGGWQGAQDFWLLNHWW